MNVLGRWREPVCRKMSTARELILLVVCVACALGQELCDENGNGEISGIVPDSENHLLVVKGENYWKLDGNLTDGFSLSAGYPKKLDTHWPGLNTSVDQAFYNLLSDTTYFVLDEQCWAYNRTGLISGYPKPTSEEPIFSPTVDDDDEDPDVQRLTQLGNESDTLALFPFHLSHIYFFKGHEYTKYRLPSGPIEPGYPKSLVPFWFQCPESTSDNEAHIQHN